MRPAKQSETGQMDMFRSRLDQILNLDHKLVRLARLIDWRFIEERCGAAYSDAVGHPPLPTRLMAGLAILKHTYNLSDEALCAHWFENPYFQFVCGPTCDCSTGRACGSSSSPRSMVSRCGKAMRAWANWR